MTRTRVIIIAAACLLAAVIGILLGLSAGAAPLHAGVAVGSLMLHLARNP